MAQWSGKRMEYEQRPRLETAARLSVEHEAKVTIVVKMLQWNQWKVERVEPDVWKCTPPGSAWMLVRGFEALQRKTIGMR